MRKMGTVVNFTIILILFFQVFTKPELVLGETQQKYFQDQLLDPSNTDKRLSDEYLSTAFSTVGGRYYKEHLAKTKSKGSVFGKLIVINTNNQSDCRKYVKELVESSSEFEAESANQDLCKYNPNAPFLTITAYQVVDDTKLLARDLQYNPLNTNQSYYTMTRNIGIIMVGAYGILSLLPGSVTKWNQDGENNYSENIKKGPVKDNDNGFFNGFLHPMAGASYYTFARTNGYSKWDSFKFSFFMSTFFWEYGFEARAEIPSTQDLIITPVVGSLLGEVFYSWYNAIEQNDGKVLNSPALGKLAKFFLNPAGAISIEINRVLDKPFFQSAQSTLIVGRKPILVGNPDYGNSNYIGYHLMFKFNE